MDIVFDVNGTLCDPRRPMDADFAEWFRRFIHVNQLHDNRIFLVTGCSWDETLGQLGSDICNAVDFCCNELGNVIRRRGVLAASPVVNFPNKLFETIDQVIDQSPYSTKQEHTVIVKQSMITFSVPGNFCSHEQRTRYLTYDQASGERENICNKLNRKSPISPYYFAQKGGDTSIDVTLTGHDKLWMSRFIKDPCVFIAHSMMKGGNDYGLAHHLKARNVNHNDYFKVNNWSDTWEILHSFEPKPTTVFTPYR